MTETPGNLSHTPFQIGDWRVDPDTCELEKDGNTVKIEPKVMQVLVYLAENAGQVASRESLEAAIWSGMIVSYDAVSGSIIKLRKALGDDSREPKYIQTISKRGYRLIAPVASPNKPELASAGNPGSVNTTATPAVFNKRFPAMGITIALLVAFVAWYLFLGRLPIPTSSNKPSVIVLPFTNLNRSNDQQYISDGLTDDLITDLSRVGSLRVIAKQSSYFYRDTTLKPSQIKKDLGVSYIVEGSIRQSGSHMRINVQLTNAETNESVWAKRFDVAPNELIAVQDRMTKEVVRELLDNPKGKYANYRGSRGTRSFDAYDAFLQGQRYIKTRSRQGYTQTMSAYRRAIQLDPSFGRAYGAMAVTLTRGYRYQWTDLSLSEARERSLELAKKAVKLDDSNPEIYWSLAYVHLHRREYEAAEKAVKKAIDLSDNFADGYALLANIANWRGKPQEAVTDIKQAMALNPYYVFEYPSTLGLSYYLEGQYPEAIKALKDALNRNESALNPRIFLAAVYVRMNRKDDAEWEINQVMTYHPDVKLSNLSTTLPFENTDVLDKLKTDLKAAGMPA